MKYIAKPSLFNNNGMKEFAEAVDAVLSGQETIGTVIDRLMTRPIRSEH